MTDVFDRAQQREEEFRADALAEQQRRAGLTEAADSASASHCRVCDGLIPTARRRAVPGVQTCLECQTDLERALN